MAPIVVPFGHDTSRVSGRPPVLTWLASARSFVRSRHLARRVRMGWYLRLPSYPVNVVRPTSQYAGLATFFRVEDTEGVLQQLGLQDPRWSVLGSGPEWRRHSGAVHHRYQVTASVVRAYVDARYVVRKRRSSTDLRYREGDRRGRGSRRRRRKSNPCVKSRVRDKIVSAVARHAASNRGMARGSHVTAVYERLAVNDRR